MSFDKEIISRLRAQADIVDVALSIGIADSRYDKNINCPFHDDSDPSFRFSRSKGDGGYFKCFSGCDATDGSAKDVFGLVMLYKGCGFIDAVKTVAEASSFPLPEYKKGVVEESPLQQAIALAHYLFKTKSMAGSPALDYLMGRGFDQSTIDTFDVGFAQSGNHLTSYGKSKADELLELGLLRRNEEAETYDFFRNRVTIPIHSHSGYIVGFGGRVLDDAKPKYLNSIDSPFFTKGDHLFNLNRIPRSETNVAVVEGYFDVMALWQHGIKNSVCSMGTSLTSRQMDLLVSRFEVITFMFDGDDAGNKAAWRTAKLALLYSDKPVSFKFVFLKDGQDPFDLVMSKGADVINNMIERAEYLSDFILQEVERLYLGNIKVGSAEKMAHLNSRINSLMDGVPNSLFKETLFYQLSAKTGFLVKEAKVIKIDSATESAANLILEKVRSDFPDCDVYIEDKSVLIVPI